MRRTMALVRLFFLIALFNIFGIQNAQAEETDQFTLPPIELVDIGPTASRKLYEILGNVIAQTNFEIQTLIPKSKNSRYAASKLASLFRGAGFADLVYNKTGPGFPRWMRWSRLPHEIKPLQYKEKWPWNNVYWLAFSQSPSSLLGLAPTINMYNYHFGTDKLGHFFMMGHSYYTIYENYLNQGKSSQKAHAAIVTYGQILEQTYLGTLINGIYSNADLSANYAGWKFYRNLTHRVKIGGRILPPILILKGDKWEFSQQVNKNTLLKPFLSDNLNEALNPCRYTFTRNRIRNQVKKRCADWIAREGITHQKVIVKLEENSRWHGESYGHWLPASDAVTLNSCFGGQ